ncbi:hypothetical protein T4E_4902 [Trichinella pseudospiralis]|uniref:Major sperm protein n=1 Tax=Trichinella pseudospiralis TaxID=6337 RepID=A0A0V0Y239_TRIPS|nr:hypothetical protein T4E_4902 [Trichinella pseudospiralis]
MSSAEDSNKALEQISLPFQEIKVCLSCTQWRHIEFAIRNPTDIIIGFHLKSTRPSFISLYPTYGFIDKNSHVIVKVHFPKVDEYRWIMRTDRLTVLLAVKPECMSIKRPELLWNEKNFMTEIYARKCITINYKRPFENETIKKSRRSSTKGKSETDQQINEQKKQSLQHVKAEVVAKVSKTAESEDDNDESDEEESNEDFTDDEKNEAKQDKQ